MRKLPVTAAFAHVVRSTIHNLGFAFHLSWPWMLAILPFNVVGNVYAITSAPNPGEFNPAVTVVSVFITILTMFAFSSIAVSWHRYILLDEVPRGWARLRTDNTVWRYFGNTLLIMLMIVGCAVPLALVVALLIAGLGTAGVIVAVPLYIAATFYGIAAFYRWSIKLPAIALERRDFTLRDAWNESRDNFWPLVGLAFLFAAIVLVVVLLLAGFGYLTGLSGNTFALFVLISVQLFVNWFVTIMAVTLLTSLYGFFVEKRDF